MIIKLSCASETDSVFVSSNLVSDNQKTDRARVITLADGTRRICGEVVVDVKTLYISGKVHVLCLDYPFADVIIGNNVSIEVLSYVKGDNEKL